MTLPDCRWALDATVMGGTAQPALVEIEGVRKYFRGIRPLRIESLVLNPGDRVAVSGLDAASAEVFVNLVSVGAAGRR